LLVWSARSSAGPARRATRSRRRCRDAERWRCCRFSLGALAGINARVFAAPSGSRFSGLHRRWRSSAPDLGVRADENPAGVAGAPCGLRTPSAAVGAVALAQGLRRPGGQNRHPRPFCRRRSRLGIADADSAMLTVLGVGTLPETAPSHPPRPLLER
jgi:hypothetical protein